ncbi:MAG: isocitrate lyase/PEP mutase family protein [Gemmatimonadetes bacterium]|nr:isocitrate lyase/PEP mutase family protein [Gemmatimonadota bacterium]
MDKASRRKFIQRTGTLAGGAFAIGLTPASAAAPAQEVSRSVPSLSKTQKLRALLRRPGIVMAPEAYTVIAAKLAEAHGFEAIYIGGNMMSGTYLGVPDWGVITTTDMAAIAGRIAREVSIPAIVDADQAGETALNVYRTVQQYERAGIAALHIEDSVNPKKIETGAPGAPAASHLQSLERMVTRIRAALDGRSDPDFVIIARTEESDIDAIIRRGNALAKAGADVLMAGALGTMEPEQIDRLAREVPIPLLGINLRMHNVRDTKLKVNVYANLVSGPAMALCDTLLRELKERGEVSSRPEYRVAEDVMGQLTSEAAYRRLAEMWTATP